jgi:hypothetical protein
MRSAKVDVVTMTVDDDILSICDEDEPIISVVIESDVETLMNQLIEIIDEEKPSAEVEAMIINYDGDDVFTIWVEDQKLFDIQREAFRELCEGILDA